MQKKVVFLDRDGVINDDIGYLHTIEQCQILPFVFEGCRQLRELGYEIVIITNQSGLARGFFSLEDYLKLTQYMTEQFALNNIKILGTYCCPHHPQGIVVDFSKECDCRKPKAGMLYQAQQEHSINLSQSILVGDSERDILAGKKASLKNTYLISENNTVNTQATETVRNLLEVVQKEREIIKKFTLC